MLFIQKVSGKLEAKHVNIWFYWPAILKASPEKLWRKLFLLFVLNDKSELRVRDFYVGRNRKNRNDSSS